MQFSKSFPTFSCWELMSMTFKSQIHVKPVVFSFTFLASAFLHNTSDLKGHRPERLNRLQFSRPRPLRILSNPPQGPASDPSISAVSWRSGTKSRLHVRCTSGARRLRLTGICCSENPLLCSQAPAAPLLPWRVLILSLLSLCEGGDSLGRDAPHILRMSAYRLRLHPSSL